MSEYIRTIIAVVLFVTVISAVMPNGNISQVLTFASGLFVVFALLFPLPEILQNADFSAKEIKTKELNAQSADYIMEEFEKTLAERIKENLEDETDVTVNAQADENGRLSHIDKVMIEPYTSKTAKQIAALLQISEDRVTQK